MFLSTIAAVSALVAVGTLIVVNVQWFRAGHRDRFPPFV